MDGQFKRFLGKRVWVGGRARFVDWCRVDEMSWVKLSDICGAVGLEGCCDYFYRKPMTSLNEGLVWVKDKYGVSEMCSWVPAFHEIELFVVHPTEQEVCERLYGEAYVLLRQMWPKAVVQEISDEEAEEITRAQMQETAANGFLLE